MAVHMTQLTDAEIELIADRGVNVVHCPESNLKLASGLCPTAKLHNAGVNVALGTDGAGSNNDLDMFGEMRTAALLAKGISGDAGRRERRRRPGDGHDKWCAGSWSGRKEIGSLVAGKAADLACVDLSVRRPASRFTIRFHSSSILSSRDQVSDVWVAGQPLLQSPPFNRR